MLHEYSFCALLTYAHRSRWSIGHQRPPAIALCSGLLWSFRTTWSPAVSTLLQCLASNCCETGLSFSSLSVPGQGLACGAGCWISEGVSDPASLPPQYLLGHWFLSPSLPQIFIWDLLLPLDFVNAPQTGVEECLDLLLSRLCCPLCLTPVKQDWLHTGFEDAEFGSHADSSRCPDVFVHDESCSASSGCDISVCASQLVNHASQIDKRLHLLDGLPTNCDWCVGSSVHLHQLSLLPVDHEPCPC